LNGQNSEALTKLNNGANGAVTRLAQPHTIIPERPRLGIITYTVQGGDTVQAIADRFGLDPTSIMWANPAIEDAPDLLRIGQEVVILPIDGVYHKVAEDDTLESIAEKYKIESEAIVTCEYNHLVHRSCPRGCTWHGFVPVARAGKHHPGVLVWSPGD
jgi:murein DD-endopeptidase MepM/ murein hydrolase activator NlpD